MKVALGQINPTIGDFSGNARKIVDASVEAARQDAQLILFPELAVCGYPPADLLEKPSFLARAEQSLAEIAQAVASCGIAVLCGAPTSSSNASGKHIKNSAVLLRHGRIEFVQSKMLLPYYDVFDEQRYFLPAGSQTIYELGGERIAITICEDAWNDKNSLRPRRYPVDPIENLMQQGATVLVNLSASPYWRGKRETRLGILGAIAKRRSVPVLFVNQVGGNDSLVFDGSSFVLDADGRCVAQAASFQEDLLIVDLEALPKEPPTRLDAEDADAPPGFAGEDAAVYRALVLGTRDYVHKCGFSKAIVGLSGGIDSALVAVIAAEALGPENVLGVGMPSEYSSQGSVDDARDLARNLGIEWQTIPIRDLFDSFMDGLKPLIGGHPADTTEENLQPRIRGTLLMALSNRRSALVLATGNKSEMSTGYCTLYGDMVGALAVIGDVYKTSVCRLAAYVNREREVIPENTLRKPPSAELRPDQRDTDTLPAYDILDPILEAYIERHETAEMIASGGVSPLDADLVRNILRMVERSEYKRQQAAPVLKVTPKSFGFGRRFPIAAKSEDSIQHSNHEG